MRKSIIGQAAVATPSKPDHDWTDVGSIASVEVTSEDPEFPVESVFNLGKGPGWRASEGGQQTIRVIFDEPQRLKRVWLRFVETGRERTQEFTLRWSGEAASSMREIVRQQWNFSPDSSPVEIEDYGVDLNGVSVLELTIKPDIGSAQARATLAEWRLA